MKEIGINKGSFTIKFPYDPHIVTAVKQLFRRREYDVDNRIWEVPFTPDSVRGLTDLRGNHGFVLTAEAQSKFAELTIVGDERETNLIQSREADAEITIEGLNGELRPFQRAGVRYGLRNQRIFIADEMGLGKSIESIATIQASQSYPAVVVCPASLKLNWKKEIEKWVPDKFVTMLNGRNSTDKYYGDVVIVNYENVEKNLEQLKARKFKAIILDEFQLAKNNKAKRSKAVKELAKDIPMRLGLTGTPIVNRPSELISQLDILGRLNDLGGFWEFAKRYCGAYRDRFGLNMKGAQNLEELNQRLRSICFIRRNKKDVLTELPAKQRAIQYIELSNQKEYDYAEAELVKYLKQEAIKDRDFLQSIADLPIDEQILAKHERMMSREEKVRKAEHLVRIEALKQLCAEGKMEATKEWISNFLESGEKLVVFATHKHIIYALGKEFKAKVITGDTPIEERDKAVTEFQTDPEVKVIVLNIKAGGVGFTLTKSSNVVFLELAWTPADHSQAEDRVHRITQESQVTAWYLLAHNTIDTEIWSLLEEKNKVVTAVTEGTEIGRGSESVLNNLISRLTGEGNE